MQHKNGENMNKVMMVIMDGFGIAEPSNKNAISQAKTPFIDELFKKPNSVLKCSGSAVGPRACG